MLSALEPGDVINRTYKLVAKLQEGTGGQVWSCLDKNESKLAIKFLKWPSLRGDRATVERFKAEFKIFKELSHPNIASIYDFGYDQERDIYFFTSELFEEGNLLTAIGQPVPTIESYLLQSLRALEYLRSRGILHLDVKPQNLMMQNPPTPPLLKVGKGELPTTIIKLIDFGLAALRPPDKPGGTANYISPECAWRRMRHTPLLCKEGMGEVALPLPHPSSPYKGEGSEPLSLYPEFGAPDTRSDLYSLGVTFYFILTGVHPFAVIAPDGKLDQAATMKRHMDPARPRPPSFYNKEVPTYLDNIIMRLIQYLPGDRYQTPLIAAQALWYRSPHRHTPETPETLLSYLPKEGVFIGRHKERELLSVILSPDFAEGERRDEESPLPPITFILGKKGTGKTRMLAWLKPLAQRLGFEVCDSVSQLSVIAPACRSLLPAEASAKVGGTSDERRATSERTNEQTLVLIDDLHLLLTSDYPAITTAVATIRSLITDHRSPITGFVFAFNPDELPFEKALSALGLDSTATVTALRLTSRHRLPQPLYHVIKLSNFTTSEVSEYLKTLLGEPPDPEVVSELHSLTNGNPRYLTDYLEELIKNGRLFSLSGRPDKETLKTIGVDLKAMPAPVSLQEHIISIYEALPYPTKQLVGLMAILGRPASVDELGRIMPQINVAGELLELVKQGVVRRSSFPSLLWGEGEGEGYERTSERANEPITYTFTNPATYHIISSHLSKSSQMELHSLIAAELRGTKDERRRTHRPSSIVGDYTAEFPLHLGYGENTPESRRALEKLTKHYLSQGRALEAIESAKELLTRIGSPSPLLARLRQRRISATQPQPEAGPPLAEADRRLRRKRSSGGRGEGGPARRSLLPAEALAKAGGEGGGEGERAYERTSARAHALLLLGDAYEQTRDYTNAKRTWYQLTKPAIPALPASRSLLPAEALAKAGGEGGSPVEGYNSCSAIWCVRAYEKIGISYLNRRFLKEARRNFLTALSLARRKIMKAISPSYDLTILRVNNFLAAVDWRAGNLKKALNKYKANYRRAVSLGAADKVTNNELAAVLHQCGRDKEALSQLKKEIAVGKRCKNPQRLVNLYCLLGEVLRSPKIAKTKDSVDYFRKGLEVAKRHRILAGEQRLQNGLGNLHLEKKDYKTAIDHYWRGLQIANQLSDTPAAVETMYNLALAYSGNGEPNKAIENLELALDFMKAPKGFDAGIIKRFKPSIMIKLADIYLNSIGDLDRAAKTLKRLLPLASPIKGLSPALRYSIIATMAEMHIKRGKPLAARRLLPRLALLAKNIPDAQSHLENLKRLAP